MNHSESTILPSWLHYYGGERSLCNTVKRFVLAKSWVGEERGNLYTLSVLECYSAVLVVLIPGEDHLLVIIFGNNQYKIFKLVPYVQYSYLWMRQLHYVFSYFFNAFASLFTITVIIYQQDVNLGQFYFFNSPKGCYRGRWVFLHGSAHKPLSWRSTSSPCTQQCFNNLNLLLFLSKGGEAYV